MFDYRKFVFGDKKNKKYKKVALCGDETEKKV